jgi:REP element-mobilizing transposase RayT
VPAAAKSVEQMPMGRGRENEPPMPDPLAYFLTWPTYGTWLPGDERGWIQYRRGWQLPDAVRKLEAEAKMTEDACRLDDEQRDVVERQIGETCNIRGWELHAVNCRSNHAHVVVTASEASKTVRNQLKAWCTRRLKELEVKRRQADDALCLRFSDPSTPTRSVSEDAVRENSWAERGSQRFINDSEGLEAAILYVLDGQDYPRAR